ncbi:MAG: DNA/RNA non-specific endonuclease [Streptococcaceae bacterium]|jgi:DNA-entry nuclease|nr:DNA/RNA non-specific endonuclease [Streptococcaceae bacterium]
MMYKKILPILASLMLLGGCSATTTQEQPNGHKEPTSSVISVAPKTATKEADVDYGSVQDKEPTESLCESVLTPSVLKQLGGQVSYNGNGSFIVANNDPNITVTSTTKAYAKEPPIAANQQLQKAVALLNHSTYQGSNRSQTSSDGHSNSSTIDPPGWHQMKLLSSPYSELYNRGHSLGYALVGNLPGFDASEANPDNISSQTAWANQADGGSQGDGQNYYEGIVRDAIKSGETVEYSVQPVYDGNNIVPSGSEIEAKGIGNDVSFNVFVPNVEPGVAINYATGLASIQTGKATVTSSQASATSASKSSQATNADSNFATSKRVVYVASKGKSNAYWYNENDMPSDTNRANVVTMTEAQAIAAGKHHSEDEK